jgi:hypothetical protein
MRPFLEVDQIGDKLIKGNIPVDVERLDEYCAAKFDNIPKLIS